MAAIVDSVFGEKALQLGGEEFVRKMRFGNSWNNLCIAVRLACNGIANITGGPRFAIGVCSGDTNTFTSATCTGWAGMTFNSGSLSNWNYSAVSYYSYGASGDYACGTKKIESVVTDTGAGGVTGNVGSTTGITPRQTIACITLNRASSSSYLAYAGNVGNTQIDNPARHYDLLRVAEDQQKNTAYTSTFVNGLYGGITHTGLPSVMDTVSIYWNKVTPTIEIYDIVVVRFD